MLAARGLPDEVRKTAFLLRLDKKELNLTDWGSSTVNDFLLFLSWDMEKNI